MSDWTDFGVRVEERVECSDCGATLWDESQIFIGDDGEYHCVICYEPENEPKT